MACEGKGKSEIGGSVLSSNSSPAPPGGAGPKFGAEGYNINRMLALKEKSKTVSQKPQVSARVVTS